MGLVSFPHNRSVSRHRSSIATLESITFYGYRGWGGVYIFPDLPIRTHDPPFLTQALMKDKGSALPPSQKATNMQIPL